MTKLVQRTKVRGIQFPALANYGVIVVISPDIKKAMSKFKETKNVPYEDVNFDTGEAWSVHVSNEPKSFMFLKPTARVGTIAHESWHVVHRIMEFIDAKLENEVVAYHLGYLAERVHRMFKRGLK